jgi:flavin reductase (DIM6/NTAB) family NADH-FMN oxidoreductase RutF/rubredoxin
MKYSAFHKLSYGLYIITSVSDGTKAGYIANTVFQVTSTPPLLAISCHKNNDTCGIILKSRVFAVSVLKKEVSSSLIGEFGFMASSEIDKFRKVNFESHITGAPVITDSCMAWFDCRVVETTDLGTHMLIIGEVADCDVTGDDEPLTYAWYREKYKMLSPRNAPTFIEKSKLDSEEKVIQEKVQQEEKRASEDQQTEYYCTICGFRYNPADGDPSLGIEPGTPFEDLSDDYRCPICNASKEYFREG